mmetsp:Transcript_28700/g.44094  ORF Transcript_28700/g.44094 Transcript_28700/m.44094 type:complete len:147 (-) Transcript_28700:1679-2119(-)
MHRDLLFHSWEPTNHTLHNIWIMLSMLHCIRTKPTVAFAFISIGQRQECHHNLWHCLRPRDFHSYICKRSSIRSPITSGWKRSSVHGNNNNNNKNNSVSSCQKRKKFFQSIEWSPYISSIYNQLQHLHQETNNNNNNNNKNDNDDE